MSDTPKCKECEKTEAAHWFSKDLCIECHGKIAAAKTETNAMAKDNADKDKTEETTIAAPPTEEKRLRKSTRSTRFKANTTAVNTATTHSSGTNSGNANSSTKAQPKGRNRRSIFKRVPFKRPYIKATTHTVSSLFHNGSYLQIGDIVSLVDKADNIYYAQIRGLLIDDFNEKSAFLTWLIPTTDSPDPKKGFDAATYLIGPDEEISRKLSCMEFIMHAPSNYYLDRTTPYPLPDELQSDVRAGGFIWTRMPDFKREQQ